VPHAQRDRGTALPLPTRLADGLELEVFYVTCPIAASRFAPCFAMRNSWFPRVAR